jgi:glycosyltransferase involved in cell wall biosynthesis
VGWASRKSAFLKQRKIRSFKKNLNQRLLNKISAVIPAFNEESRITDVILKTKAFVHEILVIDDDSSDNTADCAIKAGAHVLSNNSNLGYLESLKKGLRNAQGDIIITLDADGEHDPMDIPHLVKPIMEGHADMVLGKRQKIPRISERLLNWLTHFRVPVRDSGTGFRAIKKEFAEKLDLRGKCTCGILVLETNSLGGEIVEVSINTRDTKKKMKVAWHHLGQLFHLLGWLFFVRRKNR